MCRSDIWTLALFPLWGFWPQIFPQTVVLLPMKRDSIRFELISTPKDQEIEEKIAKKFKCYPYACDPPTLPLPAPLPFKNWYPHEQLHLGFLLHQVYHDMSNESKITILCSCNKLSTFVASTSTCTSGKKMSKYENPTWISWQFLVFHKLKRFYC